MKRKVFKRTLSILLVMVMIVGLMPATTIPISAATIYTEVGEVASVAVKSYDYIIPSLGGEVTLPSFVATSPDDQNIRVFHDSVYTYWQKQNEDGEWSKYTLPVFEEGTYRLHIAMYSLAFADGTYYALRDDTALTVDGTPWTTRGYFEDNYEEKGSGTLEYFSPEYQVVVPDGVYTIIVTSDAHGSASANVTYGRTGDAVTLTATPNDMYRLKEWQVLSGDVTIIGDEFTIGNSNVKIHAVFESTMENLGEIALVEAKSQVEIRPILGRELDGHSFTIVSPQGANVRLDSGSWEKMNSDGSWPLYKDATCTYGTYRRSIRMLSKALEDGSYYPITKNTRLIIDGVEWTLIPETLVSAYEPGDGYGYVYFNSPPMEAIPLLTVNDACIKCSVVPVSGSLTVPLGDDFSFTIKPKDYYELTNPEKLVVYVNDQIVTPDANGVYTVSTDGTDGLEIYTSGEGFTGYSNLIISANGKTVTEKVYVGETYTFKTLAEFGATVPEGSTFTGWKIGNKTYQPGDTYTVAGTTEIKVSAAFKGLHNITVENGKAYADEAHTIPISAAAEDQVIYIVADPAPEGKVFGYWTEIEISSPGGDGWFGSYDSAQTTYTVYYSDVVLAPVYETQIDNIVINGMTKPSAGVAIDNSDYSYKWGCSVPADAGYSLGICYWYDITDGEPELAMSDGDVFQIGHTYRFKAKINLYGDTILAAKEDISVALTGLDADSYTWTISEYSQIYENMVIYFEFTCEREEPDTAYIRPKGDGSEGNPFQITNIGELYWFAAFVNGTVSYPDGVTVERSEACAIVMNDITVNPGVLTENGELNGTSGFAQWTPIGYNSNYSGTFDGQEHTISGIYYAPQAVSDYRYGGFFSSLSSGGCIRNLTLADSYFRAPAKNSAYTGAFVGYIGYSCTVENCHFDGTVTTAITADSSAEDKETYQYVYIAGIAGDVVGEIRDCTARGLISGYGSAIGGIASDAYIGEVSGCVNEATVETPNSWGDIGGIAGRLYKGIIRDCCNKGNVIGRSSAGIVSNVEGTDGEVIRCWNEGKIEGSYGSGIVLSLMGSVKNCYNTGSVDEAGIVGTAYSGSSVTYCHNVGEITGYLGEPICSISSGSNITIENCYYLADSETDSVDGTTHKTADQFADGTVLALLDNGHWTQGEDDEYPVLGDAPGVTVSGMVTSFGKESEQTTVQLFPSGSETPAFSITLTGTHAMYSFKGVEAGTYTMKVSKANHVTREYTVVVGNSSIPLDAKIHLLGDVTGDGQITEADQQMIYNHINDDAQQLSDYLFRVGDVNGDGKITAVDKKLIYNHIHGKTLW